MSGSKCIYLAQKALDHVLGGSTYSQPATVYIALSNSPFDPTSTGAAMDEVTASDYARVSVANNSGHFTAATAAIPSVKSNVADVVWSAATSSWGTPQAAYVCDASSGGHALYGSDITNPQSIGSGDTPKILAGALVFTED